MKDVTYEIALDPKYDECQRELAIIVYNPFDKKIVSGVIQTSKGGTNVNEVLAQELRKPVIEKFKSRHEV